MQSKPQWSDSSEMWIQYIVQSTEYTYQLPSWNLKNHMDNKTKIKRVHYKNVCSKFEECILIHVTMYAEHGHSYVPLNSFGRVQTQWLSHPGRHG